MPSRSRPKRSPWAVVEDASRLCFKILVITWNANVNIKVSIGLIKSSGELE